MKKLLFASTLCMMVVLILACSTPTVPKTTNLPSLVAETKSDSSDFPIVDLWRDSIWEAIEKDWIETTFNPCLKAAKIKISCASCTSVFMDLTFYINAEGRLEKHELHKARFCEKDSLEKCFLTYFYELKFPSKYYKTTLKFRLGRALKC